MLKLTENLFAVTAVTCYCLHPTLSWRGSKLLKFPYFNRLITSDVSYSVISKLVVDLHLLIVCILQNIKISINYCTLHVYQNYEAAFNFSVFGNITYWGLLNARNQPCWYLLHCSDILVQLRFFFLRNLLLLMHILYK